MKYGYQLSATQNFDTNMDFRPKGARLATYREAENEAEAMKLCKEEFPEEEGWIDHSVERTRT